MINFKITDTLIKQVTFTVKSFGECYLLGDGNFYTDKAAAIIQKTYAPADREEATFMLSFFKPSEVPQTITEMQEAFWKARTNEERQVVDDSVRENRNVISLPKEEKIVEVVEEKEEKVVKKIKNNLKKIINET